MSFGLLVWLAGIISASFSQSVAIQILTQGIIVGFGCSFIYWPAISVVPQWFERYRATAVSLAVLGAGVGNLVFALGGQEILNSLGWRDTLRAFAGLGTVLLIPAIILMQRRFPQIRKGGLFATGRSLIKLKSYRWFALATFFFQWGFFVPFVHLAPYANDIGISATYQGLA